MFSKLSSTVLLSIIFSIPLKEAGAQNIPAQSINFYVAPAGSDNNPGTLEQPFASWEKAKAAVRSSNNQKPTLVFFREGTYYLQETLEFEPEDSGTERAPVVYQAYPGEKVVISGAKALKKIKWTSWKKGIYQAKIPSSIDFDQLFINGKRQIRARFPNYDYDNPLRGGKGYRQVVSGSNRRYDTWLEYDPELFSRKKWSAPTTGIVHAFQSHNWGNMQYRIKGIDREENKLLLGEGGWQLQRAHGIGQGGGGGSPFFVENIIEELDAPGEWFFNKEQHLLYYYPLPEIQLEKALVEVVVLKDLIRYRGKAGNPVRHITLSGFDFTQSRMTFMEEYEPLARGDWAIHRGGAVFMEGVEDCRIENCNFEFLGGNAIFMSKYNRRNKVSGCRFYHTGESAVCLVGDPAAVRWYVTWDDRELYGRDWKEMRKGMDLKPGPATAEYPENCVIENCVMYELGDFGKQVAGVFISMSSKINVSHVTVYNVPRAGICINDGTWGGHIIEHCDIWETVRETGEHGPFNSWGRERFWLGAGGEGQMIRRQVLLDAVAPTIIRNNRISNFRKSISAGNWTIDLDDGSSNYHIYNNLSLGSTLKLRDGYFRKVWNNIHVSAVPMGWHVWPANSGDEFYNNITVIAGTVPGSAAPTDVFIKPIRMPKKGRWGKLIDSNLYYNLNYTDFLISPGINKAQWRQQGYDRHSVFADPLFIDPAKGDYRVADNSPALQLGFKNFPMDQFGHQMTRIVPFGGEFEKKLSVTIIPDARGGQVHYTLDGSEPMESSRIYSEPIPLEENATVRAKTFKDSVAIGFEATASFTKVDSVSYPSWYERLLSGKPAQSGGARPAKAVKTMEWLGAKLINIAGGDMVDAMGGFENGAFMEYVPENSAAYTAGFRTSDIIVALNSRPIKTIEDFEKAIKAVKKDEKLVKIIRGYREMTIEGL